MDIEFINSANSFRSSHFSQAVQISGGKMFVLSGQVAFDQAGNLVGEKDLRMQTMQAFENIKVILQSVQASFEHMVKLTIFVANYQPEDRVVIVDVLKQYINPDNPPANTLLGVQSLARPELMIEIEAVAVIN